MTGKTALSRLFRHLGGRDRIDDIRALPDRRVLIETYIPALARIGGRVLWIGCRAYTRQDYPALARHGAEVWTTDIDPKAVRWGQPGRHRTGDVCAIDQVFAEQTFDAVVCNGVLGFGADTPQMQDQALAAMGRVLRPGGLLLLGWNTDKIDDPLTVPAAAAYKPAPFAGQPPRVRFDAVTHVYDTLHRL
ncbi:MAG: methyltransferase [Brevundimonas sp.]|uniref:class I SAM-dependent methyltransferase n=1 Tax=Brevundimonas sp. TaxID=1871086 RepID=UPI000DB6A74B|nr:class I SAM-dependent methyltransferase [Brevundimonas sp.]PZU77244.1 MAG: methyltransferase [Brevundimonas sp.]